MSFSFPPGILKSPTGATLQLYRAVPPGRQKAAIHINHGMAEHAARYQRFAEALYDRGYAVFAQDHRGHGATTAPDAQQGSFGKAPALSSAGATPSRGML